MSLIELLTLIGSLVSSNGSRLKLKFTSVDNTNDGPSHSFPSVTKGWISIQKSKDFFGFVPTQVIEAFKATVEFYNDAYSKYPKHRRTIEKDVCSEVFKKKDDAEKSRFNAFVENFSKQRY